MFHYGKTPEGELEIRLSGYNVAVAYRVLQAAGLIERRDVHELKTYIEENFKDEIHSVKV